ncbi:hypothetical protein ACH475_06255 [Streptomyces globisporus]
MTAWQIIASATGLYALCALALVAAIDRHPLAPFLALLRRIGGHR